MRSPTIVSSLEILTNSASAKNTENDFIISHFIKAPSSFASAAVPGNIEDTVIVHSEKPSDETIAVENEFNKELSGDTKSVLAQSAFKDQEKLAESLKNHNDEAEKIHIRN